MCIYCVCMHFVTVQCCEGTVSVELRYINLRFIIRFLNPVVQGFEGFENSSGHSGGFEGLYQLSSSHRICMWTCADQEYLYAELQIVFRDHGPNDPWLCKMMGQFSKGWVYDNLKCTHLNHSLYLWKTLLTKWAVAGFQLWVSSLVAFCLANRRFSLLRDKEVDVRWLVLVLGCQLITCSDARQGSRSSPSTVSYVLHTQRC